MPAAATTSHSFPTTQAITLFQLTRALAHRLHSQFTQVCPPHGLFPRKRRWHVAVNGRLPRQLSPAHPPDLNRAPSRGKNFIPKGEKRDISTRFALAPAPFHSNPHQARKSSAPSGLLSARPSVLVQIPHMLWQRPIALLPAPPTNAPGQFQIEKLGNIGTAFRLGLLTLAWVQD